MSDEFFVIATQNPIDQHGTFPLPEAQLDRFTMKLSVGYPHPQDELQMLRDAAGRTALMSLAEPLFRQVHEELLADGRKRGLLHLLHPHHRFALSPLGFVTADARPGCLVINSFHTFPAECALLKTQTLIERV